MLTLLLIAPQLVGPEAPRPAAELPEPAFLELAVEAREVWVGQVFALRARFGFELGFRQEGLVPLFRQALELPVQLELPFAQGLDCAAALPLQRPDAADAPRLVLGERVVAALPLGTVERDGRAFEAFEVELGFRATCPGPLALAGATLRYREASGFRQDLFEGRVPLDARERSAAAGALQLVLRALPEDGRPPDFGGAVGDFSLTASAEPRELVLGETLRVTCEVRGSGDLDGFERPRPAWPGFTFLGATEERLAGARRIRFDLRPESTAVHAVPAVELPFFRPALAPGAQPAYARASSAPITILVRPAAAPRAGSAGPAPQPSTGPAGAERRAPWSPALAALLSLAGALAAVLLVRRALRPGRKRGTRGPSPEARALEARLAAGDDPGSAWADYLARRLDCAPAALTGPGLAERLVAAGAPAGAAARAADLLELLVAARYGGAPLGDAPGRARRAAAELESDPS